MILKITWELCGKARLTRGDDILKEGLINSLKRHKDDAKEVKEGLECGIGIEGVKKFQEGDVIEVYEIKEVKRKLNLNWIPTNLIVGWRE